MTRKQGRATVVASFRIPGDLYVRLKALARASGLGVSGFIRRAIKRDMETSGFMEEVEDEDSK